ncbi:MAG: ABC transporter permease [bacterium]|nr:ABC transporter permease [bacterium]
MKSSIAFLASLFIITIQTSTPLLFASLGGILSERSGIINIGLEGIMLTGAFTGGLIGVVSGNPWLGFFGAIFAGALMGFIHAIFCIKLKTNHVISGLAINIFASGLTIFLTQFFFEGERSFHIVKNFKRIGPFIPPVYIAILLVVVIALFLYKTSWGLRLRAVGELPIAADTAGVNVLKYRYLAVVFSGALAAIGGAYLPYFAGSFTKDMAAGRGYIALAAVIFGNWNPWKAFIACIIFGLADAVQMTFTETFIPSQFIQMLPYIVTLIALIGFIGKSTPPLSLGKHYEKKES